MWGVYVHRYVIMLQFLLDDGYMCTAFMQLNSHICHNEEYSAASTAAFVQFFLGGSIIMSD